MVIEVLLLWAKNPQFMVIEHETYDHNWFVFIMTITMVMVMMAMTITVVMVMMAMTITIVMVIMAMTLTIVNGHMKQRVIIMVTLDFMCLKPNSMPSCDS